MTQSCSESEQPCSIYIDIDIPIDVSVAAIKKDLESNKNEHKIAALEQTILLLLRGDDVSSLLMSVIRFIVPYNHNRLKRLAHLFFQVFDMCEPDGNIREEIILVCNALRNDLCSHNEYVRGSVLRLLSKITYWNIVQPLMPSVIDNLNHHEPYVYRNALLCMIKVAENFGVDTVSSSLNHIERFLSTCDDVTGIVRALQLLELSNKNMAIEYILSMEYKLLCLSPDIHLSIISSFFNLSSTSTQVKELMLRIVTMLLENSTNNSVRFEGSNVLMRMSTASVDARRLVVRSLVKVLLDESDLNVKLVVISKLRRLYNKSSLLNDIPNALEDYVMDAIRALTCTNLYVTYGILSLVLPSLNRQNVNEILSYLKREFMKLEDSSLYTQSQITQYRVILIKAIHYTCGVYPESCNIVYDMLLSSLSHRDDKTATDVALFFKQLTDLLPQKREETIRRLLTVLNNIPNTSVLALCFWIIGEYINNYELASYACDYIHELFSPFPITSPTDNIQGSEEEPTDITTTIILEDGTYGTQIVSNADTSISSNEIGVRKLVLSKCDILLYNSIGQCLLKLVNHCMDDEKITTKVCIVISSLIQILQLPENINNYSQKRLKTILTLIVGLFKDKTKYSELISKYINLSSSDVARTDEVCNVNVVDDLDGNIKFSILSNEDDEWNTLEDNIECEPIDIFSNFNFLNLSNSTASAGTSNVNAKGALDNYQNVHEFTSPSDPVYIESILRVVGLKMYMTLYLENMSNEVLQNVRIELSSSEILQVTSTIPVVTLPFGGNTVIEINFRIKSSDDSMIYGYVYFNQTKDGVQECLTFNPMHVSLYDYIIPSFIPPDTFRTYWSDFEWEHKIKLSSIPLKPVEFLKLIIETTHMTVVTNSNHAAANKEPSLGGLYSPDSLKNYLAKVPEIASCLGESSFFVVNLFVKTLCDEEGLANLSIIKNDDDLYSGCFRIRSRTQNVALGLGDRITLVQRKVAI